MLCRTADKSRKGVAGNNNDSTQSAQQGNKPKKVLKGHTKRKGASKTDWIDLAVNYNGQSVSIHIKGCAKSVQYRKLA